MNLLLYGNRDSGHSYKVRLALVLLGLTHRYVDLDVDVPRDERPAEFRAVTQFGEVPVLVTDGVPQAQSNAILLALARRTGTLLGEGGVDAATTWLFWEANRIGFSLPNLRHALRNPGSVTAEVLAYFRARCERDLDRLDAELAGGRPFIDGDFVSIADLACCGYLFWADQAEIDLARWPAVGAWLGRIAALPGWAAPYELMTGEQDFG